MTSDCQAITADDLKFWLKPRERTAHKGDFGHTLIIGGDYGMPGAPCLAGIGAARSGSGLTTLATRTNEINCPQLEIMRFNVNKVANLPTLLRRATIVVIGTGLGQSKWSRKIFSVVMQSELPKVVDADALNLLAKYPQQQSHWVLTPHPGEAARLLNTTTDVIQKDRMAAARSIQKRYGGVCILKGAGTIVVNERDAAISDISNPGMASGGMGDLLAGIVGGLIAQKIPLFEAAKIGVYVHAKAAEGASQQGERGMLASDLIPYIRSFVN